MAIFHVANGKLMFGHNFNQTLKGVSLPFSLPNLSG
jgi:hypothetical protein